MENYPSVESLRAGQTASKTETSPALHSSLKDLPRSPLVLSADRNLLNLSD